MDGRQNELLKGPAAFTEGQGRPDGAAGTTAGPGSGVGKRGAYADGRDKNGLTEAEAIERYRARNYPKPALTADIAIFSGDRLLLIRRGGHPFLGCWALPGGFAEAGETVEQTAARELAEETGLTDAGLRLVGVYSAPGRDPRGWTVSVAYAARVEQATARAGDDAAEAAWFPVRDGAVALPAGEGLSFDHAQIIADAARVIGLT